MDPAQRLLLLQITDSVFPIGGYSHSYGLETYIQRGLINREEQAETYIRSYIKNSFCHNELMAVRYAYEAAIQGDQKQLKELEKKIAVSKTPMEIRSAGEKLAARFIKTVGRFKNDVRMELFNQYIQDMEQSVHTYTVVFGMFCGCMEIEIRESMISFAYSQISALLVNCVKSIPLSQLSGQQILNRLSEDIIEAVENALVFDEGQFLLSYPGMDLRCMQHEDLYSRIFMS